eukprot:jgi/Mesvir1/1205/Mv17693-RA.1
MSLLTIFDGGHRAGQGKWTLRSMVQGSLVPDCRGKSPDNVSVDAAPGSVTSAHCLLVERKSRLSAGLSSPDSSAESATTLLSREDVLSLSDDFCRFLITAGVLPGEVITIFLANVVEFIPAFLGTTFARAVAAPLNPAYTSHECKYYLEDSLSRTLVLLDGEQRAEELLEVARSLDVSVATVAVELADGVDPDSTSPRCRLRASWLHRRDGKYNIIPPAQHGVLTGSHQPPSPACKEADPALLLHTSGTTGKPKGVVLSHRNLSCNAASIATFYKISPADVTILVMPLFHVHGLVGTLLTSLTSGCPMLLPATVDTASFFSLVRQHKVTWYTAVPTLHRLLLASAEADPSLLWPPAQLRFIRSSSSPLDAPLLTRMEACFGAPVLEAYSMTEASHMMTSNALPPGIRIPGTVGVPVGVELAVMDDAGRRVADGSTGEVCVRGAGVITAYRGIPVSPATFFDADDESQGKPKWFRTGDQGYLRAGDGHLALTGRLKELINRGGEKISPAEVEAAMLSHAGVATAVAFSVPDEVYGEAVGAAVVLRKGAGASGAKGGSGRGPAESGEGEGQEGNRKEGHEGREGEGGGGGLTAHDLVEWCHSRLAHHKVPTALYLLDGIPTTATGKVQRRKVAAYVAENPHLRWPTEDGGGGGRGGQEGADGAGRGASQGDASGGQGVPGEEPWPTERSRLIADALFQAWHHVLDSKRGRRAVRAGGGGSAPPGVGQEGACAAGATGGGGGGQTIGRHTHFLSLGGNSLGAVAICSLLTSRLCCERHLSMHADASHPCRGAPLLASPLTAAQVLRHGTIARLVVFVEAGGAGGRGQGVGKGAAASMVVPTHAQSSGVDSNPPSTQLVVDARPMSVVGTGEISTDDDSSDHVGQTRGGNGGVRPWDGPSPASARADDGTADAPLLARSHESAAPPGGIPPLMSAGTAADAPQLASYSQEQMCVLSEEADDSGVAYSGYAAWRVAGATVEEGRLRWALACVLGRHQVLRSTFLWVEGGAGNPPQLAVVASPVHADNVPLRVESVEAVGGGGREGGFHGGYEEDMDGISEHARHLLLQEAATPFDLYAGPLARFLLVVGRDGASLFMANLHHAVSDAHSRRLLVAELCEAYTALGEGRDPRLPTLPVQYSEYAAWQRRWLEGSGAMAAQLGYWKRVLADAPPLLELPYDHPRPATQGHEGAAVRFVLPPELVEGLTRLGVAHGATLFMVTVALWAALLGRCARQHKVVIGVPWSSRQRAELADLVGDFVNPLPLCVELDGSRPFSALVGHVREVVMCALEHADVPFQRLVAAVGATHGPGANPLYQAMIEFDEMAKGAAAAGCSLGGAPLVPCTRLFPVSSAKVDICLQLEPAALPRGSRKRAGDGSNNQGATPAAQEGPGEGDGSEQEASGALAACITYRTDLWERDAMQRLGSQFLCLATHAASQPETPVGRLALMTPAERAQVLAAANLTTALAYRPTGLTLCDMWRRQVAARRGDLAARCGGASLTYGQLDAAACVLASALRRLGVGIGDRVAVVMQRSHHLLAALLGVMMAGGCYVTLDAANPPAYLARLLAGAGAVAVVTVKATYGQVGAALRAAVDIPSSSKRVLVADELLGGVLGGGKGEGGDAGTCLTTDRMGPRDDDPTTATGGASLNADASITTALQPHHTALCLFSSGSSGDPKGVELTHAAMAAKLDGYWHALPFTPGDACLARTPVSFVDHTLEVFGSLLAPLPVPLVLATDNEARDPGELLRCVAEGGVTRLVTVPSLLGPLLDEGEGEGGGFARDIWRLGPLSLVISSGEALPLALARRFLSATGGRTRLVNLYGSTETCGDATLADINQATLATGGVTVGRPLLASAAFVLDEAGQLVPPGVPGELCVGGPVLASGYLAQPGLTTEKFVTVNVTELMGSVVVMPSGAKQEGDGGEEGKGSERGEPLESGRGLEKREALEMRALEGGKAPDKENVPEEGSDGGGDYGTICAPRSVRVYRTGDAARLLMPPGDIELLGRLDRCVKVRGVRLELAWVESVLASVPGVAACAVVLARARAGEIVAEVGGYGDEVGLEKLVAVVAPRTVLPVMILATLHRELPPHAVPSHIMCVDELPALTSGKLDRRQLAHMAAAELREGVRRQQGGTGNVRLVAGAHTGGACSRGAAPSTATSASTSSPALSSSSSLPPSTEGMTPLEARLAQLWAAALRLPAVSLADDFFLMGGDSLMAMRLSREIRRSPEFAHVMEGRGPTAQRHLSVFRHRSLRSMAAQAVALAGAGTTLVGGVPTPNGGSPARADTTGSQPSSSKSSGVHAALVSKPSAASPALESATTEEAAGAAGRVDQQQHAAADASRDNLRFLWTFSVAMLHFGRCAGQNLRCFQHPDLVSRWAPFDGTSWANVAPLFFKGGVTGLSLLSGMGMAASATGPLLRHVILAATLALIMQYGVCAGFDALHRSSEGGPFSTTSHLWGLWAFAFNHLLAWVCLGGRQGGGHRRPSRLAFFLLVTATIQFLLPILLAAVSPPSAAVGVRGIWFGPWGMHQLGWQPLGPRVFTTVFPFAAGVVFEGVIRRQVARARSLPWLRVLCAAVFLQLLARDTLFPQVLKGMGVRSSLAASYATVADVLAKEYAHAPWWHDWAGKLMADVGAMGLKLAMALLLMVAVPAHDGAFARIGRVSLPLYLFHPHLLRWAQPLSFAVLRACSVSMAAVIAAQLLLVLGYLVLLHFVFAWGKDCGLTLGKAVLGLSIGLHLWACVFRQQ